MILRALIMNVFSLFRKPETILILVGMIYRLRQYLGDRVFWYDEVLIALKILNSSFSQLIHPHKIYHLDSLILIESSVHAPLGFLFIIKGMVLLFGNNEYAFRLFPFLCGIGSLFLFWELARRSLDRMFALFALFFFSIAWFPMYYSSELKPYSSDLFFALLLLVLADDYRRGKIRRSWPLGLAGALAVWISFPSIFVLAGVGSSLLIVFFVEKQRHRIIPLFLIGLVWALSFAVHYFSYLREFTADQGLQAFWQKSFMSLFPLSMHSFTVFCNKFTLVFRYPMCLLVPWLGSILFIAGSVSMFLERRKYFLLIFTPVLLTLIAAMLQKYPFAQRLVLFLMPAFIILMVQGLKVLAGILEPKRILRYALVAVVVLIVVRPLEVVGKCLVAPFTRYDLRPPLEQIRIQQQAGDIIYAHYSARHVFIYYAEKSGLSNEVIVGEPYADDPKKLLAEVDKIRKHPRVWVVFLGDRWSEYDFFLSSLSPWGKRASDVREKDVGVYLYEFDNTQ